MIPVFSRIRYLWSALWEEMDLPLQKGRSLAASKTDGIEPALGGYY
jgi:hypothetical protein